ncbi:MAG: thioredoxin family protein [Candidatus Eisenbacteria bacterium]
MDPNPVARARLVLTRLPLWTFAIPLAIANLLAGSALAGEPDKENTEPPQLQVPETLPSTEQVLDDEFLPDEGWDEIPGYRFLENDRPDAAAHLYTDPTRHFFLYVPSEGGVAYVLEKKGKRVSILDRDQLQWDEQSRPLPPTADTEEFTTFVDADGHVRFDHAQNDYLLEPLPAVVGDATAMEVLTRIPGGKRLADSYHPEAKPLGVISKVDPGTRFVVFFNSLSSTCGETIPAFEKVSRDLPAPMKQVRYIGVDADLKKPASEISEYGVTRLPTIVVLRNDHEIGRIEGVPTGSIETELATLCQRPAPANRS